MKALASLVFSAGLVACASVEPAEPAAAAEPISIVEPAGEAEAPAEATPIVIGTSHVIHSAVYGMDRVINVQEPAPYGDSETPPNVLYVIDGGLDQDFEHIAGLGQLASLSWTMEPMLVVGIETVDRQNELTAPAANPHYKEEFPTAGESEKFRRFIETEVMPFVEAHYRTGGRTGVIGESLAGLFIAETFLRQPDLFDDYISISPSLWWDDRALARAAPGLLAAQVPSGRRIYLTMANEGGTMQAGMDELINALVDYAPEGLTWTWLNRAATARHDTIYHEAALDALRWLYATPPHESGAMPWYMVEGGVPKPAGVGE
ncbi:MAG: alpha/beta hydrolase-fold protein [Hyphomonas sp.]|uniref:alpha/beta hydrolase n=1 Tax=Hyphomonas sp. TaxID=87 RepID=UPI0035276237